MESVQNILLEVDIPTKIKPKSGEDCFVMEFSNDIHVMRFLRYLPEDVFRLKRKSKKKYLYIKELVNKYSFNVGDQVFSVDERTLRKFNVENFPHTKVEGETVISVSQSHNTLSGGQVLPKRVLRKSGNSNYALRLELDEFGEISK